eukprot:1159868-Pelagomonas_calceolata.AAC.10
MQTESYQSHVHGSPGSMKTAVTVLLLMLRPVLGCWCCQEILACSGCWDYGLDSWQKVWPWLQRQDSNLNKGMDACLLSTGAGTPV